MDVWRITVAALRRWYVLLPMLALTVVLAMAAGQGVREEYEVTGAAMLVPGRSLSDVPNPYGGPSDAANAVAIVLNSPEARRQIAEQGLVPTYEVSPESRSTVLRFQVRGEDRIAAVDTGMAVFRMGAMELNERQAAAGIRVAERYSIDVLQAPSVSAAVSDGKLRNMAVVGVLGAALSLVLAVFFDDVVGLLRRRRRRKAEAKAAGAAEEADAAAAVESEDAPPTAQAPPTDESPSQAPLPAHAAARPTDEVVGTGAEDHADPSSGPRSGSSLSEA